jgi:hypothetical protein
MPHCGQNGVVDAAPHWLQYRVVCSLLYGAGDGDGW